MKKYWKRGAAALLSAVLAMSGIFSAGAVYADDDPALFAVPEAAGPAYAGRNLLAANAGGNGPAYAGENGPAYAGGNAPAATASDASYENATSSDALYDEDGYLADGEVLNDRGATDSDAEFADPELPDQLIDPELPDRLIDPEQEDLVFDDLEEIFFDDMLDSDALFASYVDRIFGMGNSSGQGLLRSSISAYEGLSDTNKALYRALKAHFEEIANGRETSTKFQFSAEEIGTTAYYSLSDLGETEFGDKAKENLRAKYNLDVVATMRALRKDVPFNMYWATAGYQSGFGYRGDSEGNWRVQQVIVNIYVSQPFQKDGNQFEVDAAKTSAPLAAKNNADGIIRQYASNSDLKKLIGYRDEILNLTSYNNAAASAGGAVSPFYDNPWQMVYVFDGDPETKVVCEGYAKAFKYLCDNTDFKDDSISCACMTGNYSGTTSSGEAHMWNVVSFGEGNQAAYYLADITHCDNLHEKGAYRDVRFLIGVTQRRHDGFIYRNNGFAVMGTGSRYFTGAQATYSYDEDTLAFYSEQERRLSLEDYSFPVYLSSIAIDGSTGSVANVQGGGRVFPSRISGEGEAAVKASETPGYRFLGWYNENALKGDFSENNLLSHNYSDNVLVEEPCTLVAVYESAGEVSLNVRGGSFTVSGNGSSTDASGSFSEDYAVGTEITLTYTGDNFVRWSDAQGVKLSENTTYSFTITGNTDIKAESASAADGTSLVRFLSASGQTIWSGQWTAENAGANYDQAAAAVPYRYGYRFDGWSMSKQDVINAINAGTRFITVEPNYTAISSSCSVTIISVCDGVQFDSKSVSGYVGQYKNLSPKSYTTQSGGLYYLFRYWALDKEGTQILSYSQSYSFGFTGNQTLYAIYKRFPMENHTAEMFPAIAISAGSSTGSVAGENLRYPITIRLDVPMTYTILDMGILYDNQRTYTAADEDAFTLEGGALKASFGVPANSSTQQHPSSVQSSATARILDKGKGVVARAYIQVYSDEYGVQTFYSNICSAGTAGGQ